MHAFFTKPQSIFARRALFQLHLWTGLIAGLYIVVVSITGAALVFRIDMQRALHPHLFTPGANGPLVDAATVMERLRAAYPNEHVSGVDAPTTGRPTYLAYVSSGNRFLTLLVDPVTADILGELPDRSLVRTIQDLHFDLLAGRTGRVVNGIGAVCLLVMCMTGLVIWWPGIGSWRRSLAVDFTRSWKRINWDLHSAIGFWTVSVLAMWAVTGIYFVFPSEFKAAVNAVSPVTVVRPPQSQPGAAGPPPTWRALITRAQQRAPGQFVARVVVPSTPRSAFLVMFAKVSPTPLGATDFASVYLDQFSGEFLTGPARQRASAGDVVMAWVAPLHVGSFGGTGVRVAWLLLGLAPPLLFLTGAIMWWTRVARPRLTRMRAVRLKPDPT